MDDPDQAIVHAVRRLTIAVWALVIVVALFVLMYVVAYVPWLWVSWNTFGGPHALSSHSSSRFERFSDLSFDKQIEAASVIAIARYQKEGEKLKCVISEILKRSPDTDFDFKVGDEYPRCTRYPKANESFGDGVLMFFVDSPAEFRYSTSFSGDRLSGFGEMPIEVLRAKIKGDAK